MVQHSYEFSGVVLTAVFGMAVMVKNQGFHQGNFYPLTYDFIIVRLISPISISTSLMPWVSGRVGWVEVSTCYILGTIPAVTCYLLCMVLRPILILAHNTECRAQFPLMLRFQFSRSLSMPIPDTQNVAQSNLLYVNWL
jgi:hypothetical protein